MAIKLTKSGVKDIRTENIDIPKKESQIKPLPKENSRIPVKEAVRDWNNKPEVKSAGVVAITKIERVGIWIFAILCFVLLATHVIWSNVNISSGKMQGNISLVNNVDTPDVPVTVNDQDTNNYHNNFTIQNNNTIIIDINVDDEIAQKIADEVQKIINNNTNSS